MKNKLVYKLILLILIPIVLVICSTVVNAADGVVSTWTRSDWGDSTSGTTYVSDGTWDYVFKTKRIKAEKENPYDEEQLDAYYGAVYENFPDLRSSISSATGKMPQYYKSGSERSVRLEKKRYLLDTEEWRGEVEGSTVWCAMKGYGINWNGYTDFERHYYTEKTIDLGENGTVDSGVGSDETLSALTDSYKTYLFENKAEGTARSARDELNEKVFKDSDYDTTYVASHDGITYSQSFEGYVGGSTHIDNALAICFYTGQEHTGSEYLSINQNYFRIAREKAEAAFRNVFRKLDIDIAGANPGEDPNLNNNEWYVDTEDDISTNSGVYVNVQTNKDNLDIRGYQVDEQSTYSSDSGDQSSIEKAYIFTQMENAYKYENEDKYGNSYYGDKYNLNDIQTAFWLIRWNLDGATEEPHVLKHTTADGFQLYDEAEQYYNFVTNDLSNYESKVKIDTSGALWRLDRQNGEYYIGPFTIEYPYYSVNPNISYIKGLQLTFNNDIKLLYGMDQRDFEVIPLNGGGIIGKDTYANGINQEGLPVSKSPFMIKFSAAKAGNPTSYTLGAMCEYLNSSEINYQPFTSIINGYRYLYKDPTTGSIFNSTIVAKYKYTASFHYEKTKYSTGIDENTGEEYQYPDGTEDATKELEVYRYAFFMQPFFEMEEEPSRPNQDPQNFALTEDGSREYKVVTVESNPKNVPLTIKLGGYVWVDEVENKQQQTNHIYDENDTRVPNIPVRLYRQDGGKMEDGKQYWEMKTGDGTQEKYGLGEYLFEDLNAMYTYRVEFDYNGQYYEATYYAGPEKWPKHGDDYESMLADWKVNSNAKEHESDGYNGRVEFNNRFKFINAHNKNYKGKDGNERQTFTKMELLGYTLESDGKYSWTKNGRSYHGVIPDEMRDKKGRILPADGAVIDEFGTLISNGSSFKEQYVNDCIITSYTDENNKNVYPDDQKQVMRGEDRDEYQEAVRKGEITASPYIDQFNGAVGNKSHKLIVDIYPASYYINLGLHKRQEVDVAVKSDIEKVTMEINNHVQEYTYDTLESYVCKDCGHKGHKGEKVVNTDPETFIQTWAYKCDSCGSTNTESFWGIEVRLSEGYYDNYYTRDVYPSDYAYKVSMYDNPAVYGKDKLDELEIYITYKFSVSNESMSIRTRIDELVDYYDDSLTYVPERSYINIETGENAGKYVIKLEENNVCGGTTAYTNPKKVFIRGIGKDDDVNAPDKSGSDREKGIYLGAGQQADFYVTFRVDKKPETIGGPEWIQLGEKKNLVELNGYSTRYEKGTEIANRFTASENKTPDNMQPAGIVDVNSTPGNIKNDKAKNIMDEKEKIIENDADKAPTLNLKLDDDDGDNRIISGYVWEDDRNKDLPELKATIGDGKFESGENTINGVTVQLVEIMPNGTEFVWREFGAKDTTWGKVQPLNTNTLSTDGGSGNPNAITTDGKLAETPIISYIKYFYNGVLNEAAVPNYEFKEDDKVSGAYVFKSFIPGNYVVRFIYGDTVKTVIPSNPVNGLTVTGQNEGKSYNGQDYKSTTYQVGVNQKETLDDGTIKNKTYLWRKMPVKAIIGENGVLRKLNTATEGSLNNWVYAYELDNGTPDGLLIRVYNDVGERKEAPILTEVSTFKDGADNNETVNIQPNVPTANYVVDENENVTTNIPVIDVNNQNGYLYAIEESELYDGATAEYPNVSDAKDIESERNKVIDYSDNNVRNAIAEVLASADQDYPPAGYYGDNIENNYNAEYEASRKDKVLDLINNTKMTAETGLMVIEFEYDTATTDIEDLKAVIGAVETTYSENTIEDMAYYILEMKSFDDAKENDLKAKVEAFNSKTIDVQAVMDITGLSKARVQRVLNTIKGMNYAIQDVNLGLEERPRAQLALNKEVTNVKVTLANGSILFDAKSEAANVLWRNHKPYVAIHNENPKYGRNILVDYTRDDNTDVTEVGLIQLTMDEEIMHGASIKVDYDLQVTNIGDVDYKDNQFYYNGANGATVDTSKIVKTKVNNVIDYVANNMQFYYKDNQNYWRTTQRDEEVLDKGRANNEFRFVNTSLEPQLKKYNTIIKSDAFNNGDGLVPEIFDENRASTDKVPLVLSQLITSENSSDDLTYKNVAEIVETSNDVGRRMVFSVVGNQDPTMNPEEIDSDKAEVIRILPPFGETSPFLAISIVVIISVGIIAVSIFFIKKKILK